MAFEFGFHAGVDGWVKDVVCLCEFLFSGSGKFEDWGLGAYLVEVLFEVVGAYLCLAFSVEVGCELCFPEACAAGFVCLACDLYLDLECVLMALLGFLEDVDGCGAWGGFAYWEPCAGVVCGGDF